VAEHGRLLMAIHNRRLTSTWGLSEMALATAVATRDLKTVSNRLRSHVHASCCTMFVKSHDTVTADLLQVRRVQPLQSISSCLWPNTLSIYPSLH
jgi:hypothetical protein